MFFKSIFLVLMFLNISAFAQGNNLAKKADFICDVALNHKSFVYSKEFSESFRRALPESYFLGILKDLTTATGKCTKTSKVSDDGVAGQYKFIGPNSRYSTLNFSVDSNNLINGLQVIGVQFPDVVIKTWDDAVNELSKLSSQTSLTIKNFSSGKSKSLNGALAKPLGSVFKLYLLGALADEVAKGNLNWDDKYPINPKWKSLPSGVMHTWPNGKLVSLKEFAEYMIKISDNTATDHLLFLLGRNLVEDQLSVMSNSHTELNSPFLSTLEMFKLKWGAEQGDIKSFINSNSEEKLNFLENIIASMPISKIGTNGVSMSTPSFINEIEWFGSTDSVCEGMLELKNKNDQQVLESLSKNTPLVDLGKNSKWEYAGFKGGSEPGVLTMSYLLKSKKGEWGCLSFAVSDEKKNIEQWIVIDVLKKVIDTVSAELF